jgi:hypothetical protein
MFSNPAFSKLDATIVAVLLLSGMAMMIEARHRIVIVAPADTAEVGPVSSVVATDSNLVDPSGEAILGPTGAATTAPIYPARLSAVE